MRSLTQTLRPATLAAVCAAALTFALPLSTHAGEDEAEAALNRATAKIDLVSGQGIGATNHPFFMEAQKKITAASEAFEDDENTQAERRAMEAEVYAEVALEASRLDDLEVTREELRDSVAILRSELGQ